MSKYRKAGFLIALLVIPVFIFLFLKGFTTNHFDLPYFRPVIEAGKVKLGSEGDTLYLPVAGWQFVDKDRAVSEQSLKGNYVVVWRNIDSIDAPARKIFTNLGRVHGLGTSILDLRIVSLTNVASEVDSSLNSLGYADTSWRVWANDSRIVKVVTTDLDRGMTEDQQTIPENNRLVLIDKSGFVRGYYNGLQPAEIDRLMAEIKILDYSDSLKK
jgi:protein SCO1/2